MTNCVLDLYEACQVAAHSQHSVPGTVDQRINTGIQMRCEPVEKVNDPAPELR